MLKIVNCKMGNPKFLSPHFHSKHSSISHLIFHRHDVSILPTNYQSNSKKFSLKTKTFEPRTRLLYSVNSKTLINSINCVAVREKEVSPNSGKMAVEGTVILKKIKTCSSFMCSVFPLQDPLINKVSLQLISAVHSDSKAKAGKVGKRAYLEKLVNDTIDLADDESAYRVYFDWDDEISVPGAILIRNEYNTEFFLKSIDLKDIPDHGNVHFLCSSWVYPLTYYENDRIFFSNKTYLPDQTPAPLLKYREEELDILRGKGKENVELKAWDRVYDYAVYNDLSNPSKGPEYTRPIYGGAEYPYPRRTRTSRKLIEPDRIMESRLPIFKAKNVYVPRDEKFSHLKISDFLGDTFKSLIQAIVGVLDAYFDTTPKMFKDLEEVLELYEGAIKLPRAASLRKNIPTKFLKALFRSDGGYFLNYPIPDIIKVDKYAWKTDEEFTRQMLAGIHPLIIRRLEDFPPVSKLDPTIYGNQNSTITKECIEGDLDGLSVEEAIERNKLFILDHHDTVMPFVRRINLETPSKIYATRTLLFLKEDGTLKPLIIELSLPHPEGDNFGAISKVYKPSKNGIEAGLWMLAKTYVTITDSGYHQLISHWLHTHAVIEPFVIASNRQLSALHPIYKLLHPHFRDTMPVNVVARQIALSAKGLFEAAVFPQQYVGPWTSALYKDWVFTEQALPRDLIKRGMAVKDSESPNGYKLVIEDYPYAVDGLEIWAAIEDWVKEYCSFYYKSDDMIAGDRELQKWWKEIREVGHGDKKNKEWWPEMKTFEELTETCATLIWVASALHAVVNFGQYPYSGYMPNRPTISRQLMPEPDTDDYNKLDKEKEADHVFLKTVTSQLRTLVCLSVIELISRHSEDEVYLGQREPGWTCDTQPLEALKKFNARLEKIEKKILERNNDPKLKNRVGPAMLPFTLLCPSSGAGITGRGIPNSVSI